MHICIWLISLIPEGIITAMGSSACLQLSGAFGVHAGPWDGPEVCECRMGRELPMIFSMPERIVCFFTLHFALVLHGPFALQRANKKAEG